MTISPGQNIGMALTAVGAHRFRSLLTVLGIVIGITTVVTVASLLTGLRQGVVTFFQELGPDNIFLFKTSGDPSQEPPKERKRRPMKPEYADYIRRWCASSVEDVGLILYVPPVVEGQPVMARVPGYETENINLNGLSPNMAEISPRDLDAGRFFTPEEDQRGLHVALIGANVAGSLFPAGDALGRTMMIDGAEYTVIGVYAKAKGGFFGENGQDNNVNIPLRTAETRYPQLDRFMITAKARPGMRQDAFDEVQAAIRRIRKVATDAPNDFAISTPDQIIQQFDRITGLIGLVAIAISALGLLVGGIGVMNIMLVSVTERTREIGVRKAIGARKRDIVGQFLVEAMTLTGAGGLLGIVIAVLITLLVGALVPSLPSKVPGWALITGFTVSVAVGVFFGVWPAVKAAQLDPVEALRYE
ncbi:MAG TPA: ABC transporter permease [Candidatus Acidoferrales bacterium]|nr:ABC transporter permease [Candidatus Acidoferrales bacterium]